MLGQYPTTQITFNPKVKYLNNINDTITFYFSVHPNSCGSQEDHVCEVSLDHSTPYFKSILTFS